MPDNPQSMARKPTVPAGRRVYAVGDVHGRLDLLHALACAIEEDNRAARSARSTVIMLGDLIDRGPHSRAVVDYVLDWQLRREMRIISGNHEEMLLTCMTNPAVLVHFLRYGGTETLESYGMDPASLDIADFESVRQSLLQAIPGRHRAFLGSFENMVEVGDYLFVHAGIRPDQPLKKQKTSDLRWIREPFLSHQSPHSHVVVHGHTITREVQLRANRIGIDTGAYRHGRLTALVLEGSERRFLQARDEAEAIYVVRMSESEVSGGL